MTTELTSRPLNVNSLTPRQIVEALDRYVIGQHDAKRMVAIALRNRWRRQQLAPELRDEVMPKNIIMIGPTGVGKTEIARRLAKLAEAPFIKVEASKFTEVGYVGRDVESIIRDLTELAISLVKTKHLEEVQGKASRHGEERLLDLLLPGAPSRPTSPGFEPSGARTDASEQTESADATRSKLRLQLREGKLDQRSVEVEVKERALPLGVISNAGGMEDLEGNLRDMLGGFPIRDLDFTVEGSPAKAVKIRPDTSLSDRSTSRSISDLEKITTACRAGPFVTGTVTGNASTGSLGTGRFPQVEVSTWATTKPFESRQ